MSLKPPPRNFSQISLTTVTVRAKDLYRVSRHPLGEPYFGKTANNRFDDRSYPKKKRFGTCCFGLDLVTAIAETVLHDEMPVKGVFNIAYTEIDSRYLVRFLAEFERDLIRERVLVGLKSARARGRKGGRPGVSKETKAMAQALMADKSLSIRQICERLGIAKSTLYKHAGPGIR